jgi:hypothetical protein
LTAKEVEHIVTPGTHWVDDELYLQVVSDSSRSWVHRYMFRGKARRSGLGSYPDVSLAEARRKRDDECAQIRQGIDPVAARKADRARACIKQVKTITFQECAEAYIKAHEVGWRHRGSGQNWRGSLSNWVYPVMGKLQVQDVDKAAVMRVLEQDLEGTTLWVARAKTAEKVRSRIESVLDFAKAREYRSGENPARWKGNLSQLLPAVPNAIAF